MEEEELLAEFPQAHREWQMQKEKLEQQGEEPEDFFGEEEPAELNELEQLLCD